MSDVVNINDHNSAPVVGINKNSSRFTYRYASLTNDFETVKYIDIPDQLKCLSLFKAYISYSHTIKFSRLSAGTQVHYAATLKRLIQCFSKNIRTLVERDDRAISVHYLIFMRDELKKSTDSIKRDFVNINVVLSFSTDTFSDYYDKESHDFFLDDLKCQMPDIKKVESPPKPVFTDLFDSEYSDDEILISMRRVLVWFMKVMQGIRKEYLTENNNLANQVFDYFDTGELPFKNNVMKMSGGGISHGDKAKANGYHLRAILDLKNPIANELMFLSSRNFNRKLSEGAKYSVWKVRRELERQFFKKESYRYVGKDIDRTNYLSSGYYSGLLNKNMNTTNQSVFPIGCMFTSTLAERRAMAWLLASDRIQASGHDKVKIESVMFDNFDSQGVASKIQIKFPKPRAGKYFTTPIYHRDQDEQFDVYYEFYQLRLSEDKHFAKVERPGYLMPSKWNKLFQRTTALGQTSHLPLLLLGVPGTEMYKSCLREVEMAKPFLEVMSQSIETSTKYRDERSKKKYYKDGDISTYPKSISLDIISQSRAVMEDGEGDDKGVTAASCAHNQRTHNDIYLNRSDISKKKSSKIRTFGSDVGDRIYTLSVKMGELIRDEPDYNRERMIERLGLSPVSPKNLDGAAELNEVVRISKESGLGTGLVEGLNYLSDTYIIQDPTIAAIIISFSKHLDRVKEHLSEEGKYSELKLATSHQIYLETLLERFHRKHIKKGRELAGKLTLPYKRKL